MNCSYRTRRLLDTKVAAECCKAGGLHTGNTSGEPPTADVPVVARCLQVHAAVLCQEIHAF